MSSPSKTISTDMELLATSLAQRKVSVMQRTADDIYAILEYGGIIERYTKHSVKINGAYYLREECEFTIE
ncbi:MAG: hypothetical protein JWM44_2932 [Bacilli bacterium]|jgi:hypothetical protein|nr:hypothetical protein [Bacilli bacterium]